MKKWQRNLLIAVFGAIFLISGSILVGHYVQEWMAQAEYDRLAAIVEQARKDKLNTTPSDPSKPSDPSVPSDPSDPSDPVGESLPEQTEPEETEPQKPQPVYVTVKDTNTGKKVEVLSEYAELYATNSDLAGWISIEGTNINYPVMHKPSARDYYLNKGFNKKWSLAGSLYIRETCNVNIPTDNVTIYGHNMPNGTMFHELTNYLDERFFQSHQYIKFDTMTEYHEYQILAVFKTSANAGEGFAYHRFENAANEEEFNAFISTCKELAFYDTGVTASFGDKLITLSTCEYTLNNGRLVVVAKRIS